jgi:predicted Zn-dependent protease with MMP-like domain
MDEAEFARIVSEEWAAVPHKWKGRVKNVAVLVEDVPSEEVREAERLEGDDMLLGIYQGIPNTDRGEGYGIGITLPDTITIYRLPTLLEAEEILFENPDLVFSEVIRKVVRDTIWHELGHYFGYGDQTIHTREDEGSNRFEA